MFLIIICYGIILIITIATCDIAHRHAEALATGSNIREARFISNIRCEQFGDNIETKPNEVYGIMTGGIETTPNEMCGIGTDDIETTPNKVYGIRTNPRS